MIIRPMPVAPNRRGIKTGDGQKKMQRPDVVGRRTETGHLGEMIGEEVGSKVGAAPNDCCLDGSVNQTWVEKPPLAALVFEPSC